ncbi:Apolipoprotein D [Amphibalanus amphitrite]|uniref:Apolipoprotein D n=1 Tax=Amphibalanus amphitrite TaxID=1232801 RepID=A0A6A4WH90_AMPAM|nr:Apolipoprotein D [Amphibalanus amphitrite]
MTSQRRALQLLVVMGVLVPSSGQLPFLGRCPAPPAVHHFNTYHYLGKWYEHSRYFSLASLAGKCTHFIYTDQGYGRIGVENQQIKLLTGKLNSVVGVARVVDPHYSGRLRVVATNLPSLGTGPNYIVVDTDYSSYAAVWSCADFKLFNLQTLQILTRHRRPEPHLVADLRHRLRYYGLNTEKLAKTNQEDCPHGY